MQGGNCLTEGRGLNRTPQVDAHSDVTQTSGLCPENPILVVLRADPGHVFGSEREIYMKARENLTYL